MVDVIAIVVPNWNGAERLESCVRSLAPQRLDSQPFEIVVVDNGSQDQSLAVLDRLADEIAPVPLTVVALDVNRGFAGGVNTGIRHARDRGATAIALFNNDAVAQPGWLAALVGELDRRPECAVITSRLLMGDGATVDSTGDFYSEWGLAFPRDRDQPATPIRESGYVFAASGGASLYRTDLFADIGLFDEDFFAYFEDVDLSFRAQLAGHRIYYSSAAVAHHDQGSTSRAVAGFSTRQFFRNLPLLLVKNVPARLLPRVASRFALVYPLMVANSFRRGQGRAAVGGMLSAVALLARTGWRKRRDVQRTRRLDAAATRALLWSGLPPGMRVLWETRDRLGVLLRRQRSDRP